MSDKIGVHRTHCCIIHGCKYGELDCPVMNEEVEQAYLCEDCSHEGITMEELIKVIDKRKQKGNTMRKIVLEKPVNTIHVLDIDSFDLIVATKNDEVSGMVTFDAKRGYIFNVNLSAGCSGYHSTLRDCIESGIELGHTFFKV